MFVGRNYELEQLQRLYSSKHSHIAVIYGRRRIGKSSLINEFVKGLPCLKFEGVEGAHTPEQIKQVATDLARQMNDPMISALRFDDWNQVFDFLGAYLDKQKKKLVIVFDEVQWLAASQSLFISLLKKYWDNHWKHKKVMLILCGSVSSYMVKRVIKSKALFGRLDFELCLGPLLPKEAHALLDGKRSNDELFNYLLLLGGIPKYLEMIDPNKSLVQNMNMLAFTKTSVLATEYEKIFYSQFREHLNYEKIVKYLEKGPASLNDIAKHLKMKSGGGLKGYLENLEASLFISGYTPYDKTGISKLKRYKLTDEYLRFYFKYILPNLDLIKQNTRRNLFKSIVVDYWKPWLGFSFENFCLKHADVIAEKLGFLEYVTSYGPYFSRDKKGFQIDLLYMRTDRTITLCEIKFLNTEITPAIIPELEMKCASLTFPKSFTLERALISRHGPSKSLRASGYFQHHLSVDDFM